HDRALGEFVQMSLAQVESLDLGPDVAARLVRKTDVREDHLDHVAAIDALVDDLDRRDAQALGVGVPREWIDRSRHGAADVRPVTEISDEGNELARNEDGLDKTDVVQMRSGLVRRIAGDNVARSDLVKLKH